MSFISETEVKKNVVTVSKQKRTRKIYEVPDYSCLKIKVIIKTLQTDKRKKNVLTLSRDAVENVIVIPQVEKNINKFSNLLSDDRKDLFYITSGYILNMIMAVVRRSLVEMEVKELSGTEGIWDVSKTFFVIFC